MNIIITEEFENRVNLQMNLSTSEFNSRFRRCRRCSSTVFADIAVEIGLDSYCPNCLFSCPICHRLTPLNHACYFEDSSDAVCGNCYDTEGYICDGCENHFRYSDSLTETDCGDYLCSTCIEEENTAVLDSYHTMKDSGDYCFHGEENRSDSPYLGVELEVDSDTFVELEPVIDALRDRWGSFMHYEADGSLKYGFECITQPASLSYHLSEIDDYKDMFSDLISYGLYGHDTQTAGFHVHIDKEYFGKNLDCAIAKMLYIFEKFHSKLVVFSRRKEDELFHWARKHKDNRSVSGKWITDTVKTAKNGYTCYSDRYHDVNLTNANTIEIRIFKSTLNPESFEATLRLVDRISRICKETPAAEIARMKWSDVLGDNETVHSYWNRISKRGEN